MPLLNPPPPDDLADLLRSLTGRAAVVKAATEPLAAGPDLAASVSTFATDEGAPVGAIACELALACLCGAALTMIPADVANQAARKRQFPDNLLENYREVMNIAAQYFNQIGSPHAVLQAHELSVGSLPAAFAKNPKTRRRDYDVTVPGYGAGKLAIVML